MAVYAALIAALMGVGEGPVRRFGVIDVAWASAGGCAAELLAFVAEVCLDKTCSL